MNEPHKPVEGEKSKSLGQVAYDASCSTIIWEDQWNFNRAAWEAGAQAVASHTLATSPSVKGLVEAIPFPSLSAGTANAIAYQLEIGKDIHPCPISDATIADWLRDIAKQLETLDKAKLAHEQALKEMK